MKKIIYRKLKIVSDAACRVKDAHIKGKDRKGESACGIILRNENDSILDEKGFYLGVMTNNQAEYSGLIKGMEMALEYCRNHQEFSTADIGVWMDSNDVIMQMKEEWKVKSHNLKPLHEKSKELEKRFAGNIEYFHHSRESYWGKKADRLANEVLDRRIKN